jgi:hypothetical protein
MKTWTVVLEIQDSQDMLTQKEVEAMLELRLEDGLLAGCGYRIMETIEAPYGPQGVSITDNTKQLDIEKGFF